jgi:hypothetical protein
LVNANQFIGNTQPNSEGVIYWESASPFLQYATPLNGLLAPSRVSNVVTIANGVGMVQGWVFTNTANVDFDFAADPGNANATDLIVMERGDPAAAQTVRLARVKGAASTLATVTQSASVWQIALAQVPLSAGGLPTSVVDVRRFVGQTMNWRQGGNSTRWDTAGTTNYLVGNVKIQAGANVASWPSASAFFGVNVTFPVPFTERPLVVGTIGNISGVLPLGRSISIQQVVTISTTGVGFNMVTADNLGLGSDRDVTVNWVAIGII